MRKPYSVLVTCDCCGYEEVIDSIESPNLSLTHWVNICIHELGWTIRDNGRDICPDCGDDTEDWENA